MTKPPKWRIYERIVGEKAADALDGDLSVTLNARIKGAITGMKRQVDVLIDARLGEDTTRRVLIDAKQRGRKVEIAYVEAFLGMMEDCQAQHGIIVCPHGWTTGAARRAQDAIAVQLLPLEEVENWSWSGFDPCFTQEALRSKECGWVLWGGYESVGTADGLWLIIATGKCDGCHAFHFWCWDCGGKFAVPDGGDVQCWCDRRWAAIVQRDGTTRQPEGVYLVLPDDGPLVLDRRPLR